MLLNDNLSQKAENEMSIWKKTFDLSQFDEYREDNREEVKKADKGLPVSLWNTYSSFANCYGGVIILGVKENKDGSWRTTGFQNVSKLRKEFWNNMNNPKKVSINLLSEDDVQTYEVGDNHDVIGERAGSGVPNIFNVWEDEGWEEPAIEERFDPDRTVLALSFLKKVAKKTQEKYDAILNTVQPDIWYKASEFETVAGVKESRIKVLLKDMLEQGLIKSTGSTKGKMYKKINVN